MFTSYLSFRSVHALITIFIAYFFIISLQQSLVSGIYEYMAVVILTRGLNLALVKVTTVQVNKLPL
jgi:hypothetical protein